MSTTNGRALTSPGEPPDAVAGQRRGRGAGDYVRGLEDTAPLDVVDRPGARVGDEWDPVVALDQRVRIARGRTALQGDPALVEALSDEELAKDRSLAEWERDQRRKHRRAAVERELARERRAVTEVERSEDEQAEDRRWHRRAIAARKRVTSPDARLAKLYRRAELSSRALIAVVTIGMAWSAVNIQRNLVPDGDTTNPLYWLSYGVESLLSVPLIVIMVQASTATMWGREVDRKRILLMEAGLLLVNVGLNAGPHLIAGHLQKAAEYAVAPVMVGVVIWLHAWISARYRDLIATVHVPGEGEQAAGLGGDVAKLLDAVARVRAGMEKGLVKPSELNQDSELAPSASKIAAVYGMRKADAMLVRDAINRLAKDPTTTA